MVMTFVPCLPHLPQFFLGHEILQLSKKRNDLLLPGTLAVAFQSRDDGAAHGLGARVLPHEF
jgi:hypothetical protein